MAIPVGFSQLWIIAAVVWGAAVSGQQPWGARASSSSFSTSSSSSSGGWEEDWEGWMKGARDNSMEGDQFKEGAWPLVQMSANAYLYPDRPLIPIPGWSLSDRVPPLRPALGGAHALAYSCSSAAALALPTRPGHVVIVFRGTQISSSLDSLADSCADKLLWEGFDDLASLPPECATFDPHTLDYFSQAVNYTRQVIHAYPYAFFLLTGHSLGAGLAILVAAALSHDHTLPVIGFGAPGTRKPLLDRGLSLDSDVIVIGHQWDVIMRTQMEGQMGLLCFYPQNQSSACEACLSCGEQQKLAFLNSHSLKSEIEGPPRRSALEGLAEWQGGLGDLPQGDCLECFFQTHYLKNLMAVVEQGQKPSCEQASDDDYVLPI